MSQLDSSNSDITEIGEAGDAPSANQNRGWVRGILEFVVAFAIMLGVIYLIRLFVMEPFTIPSGSMIPTIQKGDSIYAEKVTVALQDTPTPGQVYTFVNPNDPSETLIKRVIAVGGQTIDIHDGNLYIDGVVQDEPYVHGQQTYAMHNPRGADISYPFTIPEGCFWAMGDNRGNSSDSRVFGAVSCDAITGRAFFRYWPIVRAGKTIDIDLGDSSYEVTLPDLNLGALDYTI